MARNFSRMLRLRGALASPCAAGIPSGTSVGSVGFSVDLLRRDIGQLSYFSRQKIALRQSFDCHNGCHNDNDDSAGSLRVAWVAVCALTHIVIDQHLLTTTCQAVEKSFRFAW
jgi:hypothetical protein